MIVPLALAHASTPDLAVGQDLFVRTWVPGDPRAPLGDGLGPRYNDASCASCHALGGLGGGGGGQADVFLAIDVSTRSRLIRSTTRVVHRYGGERFVPTTVRRNTTALFGAGLVDAVPAEVIADEVHRQQRHAPGTAGRSVSPAASQPGRFGWKGDVATLRDFVVKACRVELGLAIEGSESVDVFDLDDPAYDLAATDVDALTAWVAALERPVELPVPGADHGRVVFREAGCAQCHVERLGEVQGLYSDLLLHDLGVDLADRAGGYYGGPTRPDVATSREWRTPPQWGVRDSAPYLHDGRAATLQDAVLQHGGQARASVEALYGRPTEDLAALYAFLGSLAAPG